MNSFGDFVNFHIKRNDQLRFGQRFCVTYLKDPKAIPGLFNETNDEISGEKIVQWLKDNQHYPNMPAHLERTFPKEYYDKH